MPVRVFVLILVSALAAAAVTVWGTAFLARAAGVGWVASMAAVPVALMAWLIWRALSGRLR